MPILDKPVIRVIERTLIWLEAWTGEDDALWLCAVGLVWIALSAWGMFFCASGRRESPLCLFILVASAAVMAIHCFGEKKGQVALANTRQMPVQCEPLTSAYGSVIRLGIYIITIPLMLTARVSTEGLVLLLLLTNFTGAIYWLVLCADAYPGTGGKKLKEKVEAFRAGTIRTARSVA